MPNCKNLKKNQKISCSDCGLELLVITECHSKDANGCCEKEGPNDKHFICCGKKMSLKH